MQYARAGRALLGLVVGVACLGGTAAVAAADDNTGAPSLIEFTVPNKAAIDKLQGLGYDLAEYQRPGDDGGIVIDAVVTPDEALQLAAMGYKQGNTVQTPAQAAAVKAEADADAAKQQDSYSNLRAGRAVRRAAAPDTVLASRADYFENYSGRFISIEARPSDPSSVTSENPTMTAAWDSGAGTPIGGAGQEGLLSPFIDRDPPDADYYLYHFNTFRVGDLNDGKPLPTTVRVASSNGGVDTIPVKRWTSYDGKGFGPGYLKDFTTGYTDPQAAYKKIRDLATEFPNLAQIYDLPNKTNGYQRQSQALLGLKTPYAGQTGNLGGFPNNTTPNPGEDSATRQGQAVILTSRQYGQNGGNDITAELKDPGAPNAPLSVAVAGNAITVNLATAADGKITSKAAEIVSAINASQAASALVVASTYRGNAGTFAVNAAPVTTLKDYLNAPPSYPRGPQTVQMIRIGTHRDGTKTGVMLYCEEHAREWATSLVCLETAERLLRNYASDAETKSLLDNLDIFIIPVVNADGMAYSRYDFNSQRRNMTNYCATASPAIFTDPYARNSWGVDINRNFSVGTIFDGFVGASNSCTSDVFAGPFEFSEPESRNEQYVQSTFSNIKFANNIHSSGGYFMWPPGAYKNVGRETLPYASFGVNQFFDQTAATTLERIQSYRHTTVLPARTGPVADVLYSAAGNSADEAYYSHGIIGYDFEIGVDHIRTTPACTQPGTTVAGSCLQQTGFQPCYGAVGTGGGTGNCPSDGSMVNEGHDEAMEFASGNIGLLTAARDYELDHTPPTVSANLKPNPDGSIDITFNQSEPADIYYTLDGSTPTTSSAHYQPAGPRQRVQPVHLPAGSHVDLKFFAVDIKGLSSGVQSQVFQTQTNGGVSGTVPATLSLTLGNATPLGPFVAGQTKDYTASMAANVISSAGDALLSVADPSSNATGHLVNGAFSLPSALQARGTKADTTGTAFNDVGSSASPLNLLTWSAPVSNDPVTIEFKQHIGNTDPLRTGTYSKTLTFTLSTTNP